MSISLLNCPHCGGTRSASFQAKIIASEGPSFGAYLKGSVSEGEAFIVLDILANLAVDLDPKVSCAEVLAHEVLHACQEIMGQALTEADIDNALARIQGVELESCEDSAQYIESLLRQIQSQGEEIESLKNQLNQIQKS